jgi:hypothetical protein
MVVPGAVRQRLGFNKSAGVESSPLALGECLLMAQSGHASSSGECPLSGVKRTVTNRCLPISIYEYTAWFPASSRLAPSRCQSNRPVPVEGFRIVLAVGKEVRHGPERAG